MRPYVVEVLGTPEAGKTTAIRKVYASLMDKGYNVQYVQESAEVTPKQFPKGSVEAHKWMIFHLLSNIELAMAYEPEIMILDRGTIDKMVWSHWYLTAGKTVEEDVFFFGEIFAKLGYIPNLAIVVTTTPEKSIARRGGEGRVVTKQFIQKYNTLLQNCYDSIPIPKFRLDTTNLSPDEVSTIIEDTIVQNYQEFKNPS